MLTFLDAYNENTVTDQVKPVINIGNNDSTKPDVNTQTTFKLL